MALTFLGGVRLWLILMFSFFSLLSFQSQYVLLSLPSQDRLNYVVIKTAPNLRGLTTYKFISFSYNLFNMDWEDSSAHCSYFRTSGHMLITIMACRRKCDIHQWLLKHPLRSDSVLFAHISSVKENHITLPHFKEDEKMQACSVPKSRPRNIWKIALMTIKFNNCIIF